MYGFDQQGWYGMFVACGIWCLADVSSVSPSSEQTQFFSKLVFELPADLSEQSLLSDYSACCPLSSLHLQWKKLLIHVVKSSSQVST